MIMSIENITIHFHDYDNREDFITQLEKWYDDSNWELPPGEDFGEYWDYNTSTLEYIPEEWEEIN